MFHVGRDRATIGEALVKKLDDEILARKIEQVLKNDREQEQGQD